MSTLQSKLSDALGRIQRIRRIRARVEQRATREIQRGVQGLDEDDLLPALDSHESHVLDDVRHLGVTEDTDPSSLGLGMDFSDFGPLFGDFAVDGTAVVGAGNSSGA